MRVKSLTEKEDTPKEETLEEDSSREGRNARVQEEKERYADTGPTEGSCEGVIEGIARGICGMKRGGT